MSAAAGLLQTDDVAPQSIVHTQNIQRPSNSVHPIHRHRRTLCVATAISRSRARARFLLLLCRRRRLSAQPRRLCLRAKIFLLFPFPRSRLVFCSRDVGSAVPPRVAPSIFRLRGESGAYSEVLLLPLAFRGGTVLYCRPVLVSWRWYERSDLWIQLAVHRRCHWLCRYDHGTPGLLIVSSLTSTVWVHPGREAAGVHTRRCVFLLEGKGKTRKKPHRSCRRNVGNGADLGGNEEKT